MRAGAASGEQYQCETSGQRRAETARHGSATTWQRARPPARLQIREQMVSFGIMQQHSESETAQNQMRQHPQAASRAFGSGGRTPLADGPGQCCRRDLEWSGLLQVLVPEIRRHPSHTWSNLNRGDRQGIAPSAHYIGHRVLRLMRRLDPPEIFLGVRGPTEARRAIIDIAVKMTPVCANAEDGRPHGDRDSAHR